ncbi:hypothetical protein [Candidatus Palauibacter sp.]|uniref:hypothetical protein n=1 Tax=Candidatus Palauibacter sp. TaxID=3101350 RepID=UPI003B59C814
MIRSAGEPRGFRFDVLIAGEPVRRRIPVICSPLGIQFEGEQVDLESVFWVSRRAGLVLLFARNRTLAFFGESGDLEELARLVERGSDNDARRSMLRPLAAEVVVCTAGTAVAGHVGQERISGLYLAVFTRQGLHLFAEERRHTLRWPLERAAEVVAEAEGASRPVLELAGGDAALKIRYLFPEEIGAVVQVARRTPAPPDRDGALEMFDKGEVTRPLPARPPQFSEATNTLQRACEAAVARVKIDPSIGERFDRRYFERHLQTLGEIALGPLMLRRSAALEAGSLMSAIEAMDAEQVRQDAIAALDSVTVELLRVYGSEVRTLVKAKRLDREHAEKALAAADEPSLRESMAQHIEALNPAFNGVVARQQLLLQQLHARDLAPPEAEEAGVEQAIASWRNQVARLDVAYGAAGAEVLLELAALWSGRLIPSLRGLTALRGRRLSERARLCILAIVTFLAVAALAWLARDMF